MHQLKYLLRPPEGFRIVCLTFAMFGISIAVIAIMNMMVACRVIGQIESHGGMMYWCSIGDGPEAGFSLTMACFVITLSCMMVTMAAMLITCWCHVMAPKSSVLPQDEEAAEKDLPCMCPSEAQEGRLIQEAGAA